ncbi:MAG: GNAT family N-acetyltransferase [bacterium]
MTSKEIYRQLCETEGARIPLFQQYWWMETVCAGKQWDVLLATRADGTVEGALPYLIGRRFGLQYILQPQLTQFNGPWYRHDDPYFRHRVGNELEAQLHKLHVAIYLQHFSTDLYDTEPFSSERGYHLSKRVTYRFDPIPDPVKLPSLAAKERRKRIDAVRETYCLDKAVNAKEFVDFHISYWEHRCGKDLLDKDFLTRIVQTSLAKGHALLYGLRDSERRLMAARFVVYDTHCAHSLLSALHPNALRNSMTVLTWELITDLYNRTTIYDFEGSIDPGIAHFYRSFGSTQVTYFEVSRFRPPLLRKAFDFIAKIKT